MSDKTEEEVSKSTGFHRGKTASKKDSSNNPTIEKKKLGSTPTSLNWTAEGKVTSVKDQGSCGSCWAFGALATGESVMIMNGWETVDVDLSEQYLVECTYESDCDGTYHVEYVMDEILGGVPREETYPYNPFSSYFGICDSDEKVHVAESNTFYYGLTDAEIIDLLQEGPLTVSIAASGWSYYKSGIFKCNSFAYINHVVQLVGYADDYWLIKNQWGEDWGENGYMRVSRDQRYNCLIGEEVFDFTKLQCKVAGCAQCSEGNYSLCIECSDQENTELVNGSCACKEDNKVFSIDGHCISCQVLGCSKCQLDDAGKCEECSSGMSVADGRCVCDNATLKLNPNGECSLCNVEGCDSCAVDDPNTCVKCFDCSAMLKEGQCICPFSFVMGV